LLRDGSIERVDVIDATMRCCTVAGRRRQSSFGARNSPRGEESRVHETLAARREAQMVRRRGVGRVIEARADPFGAASRLGVAPCLRLQPGADPGDRAAQRLEMSHRSPFLDLPRGALDRHRCAETVPRQTLQDRPRDAGQCAAPEVAFIGAA